MSLHGLRLAFNRVALKPPLVARIARKCNTRHTTRCLLCMSALSRSHRWCWQRHVQLLVLLLTG